MINVANRPNVYVRLAAVKFLFRHCSKLLNSPASRFGSHRKTL
jgi:hypothetical protein